jgi:hypothetical protein
VITAKKLPKILQKSVGWCTYFLAETLPKQAHSTVFDPLQVHDRNATEPYFWPKVYLADALPEEPSGIVTGMPEQTVPWPKHGYASSSHVTSLHAALRAA